VIDDPLLDVCTIDFLLILCCFIQWESDRSNGEK